MVSRRFGHLTCCVAFFLLLGTGVGHADEQLDTVAKGLATVSTFAFGGVGFAGVISKGEIDFRFILSHSEAVALATFEQLFATGNPQAKAYALAGLKKLNPDRYEELLITAAASTNEVEVMRGCLVANEPLRQVVKEIDRGEFSF
jgi:hypothetical protein